MAEQQLRSNLLLLFAYCSPPIRAMIGRGGVMEIVNHAGFPTSVVENVASRCGLTQRPVMFFLDVNENHFCREEAQKRITLNVERGWKPYEWDVATVEDDKDRHAFFCPANILESQQIPVNIKASIGACDSLIYVDARDDKS